MQLINIISVFILLSTVFETAVSYKVLIFNPAFGASHSNFLGKIADTLIDAGHDVTMLIPVYLQSKSHLVGSKKVQKIVRIGQDPRNIENAERIENILTKKIWKMDTDITSFISLATTFSTGCGYQCEYIFKQSDVIQFLKDEKFDLGLSEASYVCGYALFDHIGIKTVINADSTLVRDNIKYSIGEPISTSYYPGVYSSQHDNMDLLERFKNLVGYGTAMWFVDMRHSKELEMIKPYYNGAKNWAELFGNIAFNMLNSNQFLDYSSPVLPKTVYVGGIQVNTNKNGINRLSQEWDDILNERETNVLVSFGSNAYSSDMPDEFKSAFLRVFESMPNTTFIWKYEVQNSSIASHLPNVVLSTWMPQNDLLADSRMSLFVTHGGLGSTMELAYQGKPAVVIPLMTDQPRNANMLTRHGGAIKLDKMELNDPIKIKTAIETILKDENYKKNAEKLAKILESQPNKPKDVVLKHCDFAVKFGSLDTMKSYGRHLNYFQFHSIDLLVIFCTVSFLVISVLFIILKSILSRYFIITITIRKDKKL